MAEPAEMPTIPPPICALVGVSKRFGGVVAAERVDFNVRPGEVHALVGENGAGKSTLVKLLSGLYAPDEGYVAMAGERVAFTSPRDAEAAGIAVIPQELDLFPELSVVENLFVGRTRPRTRWGAFDWVAMRRDAQRLFTTLGVAIDVSAPVKRLSAATCQLVEIARALLREARLVIMDEPTAALTAREAQRLFGIIADLTARGVAIVYISHRLEEVFAIADRITVLRDGRLVRTAPAADFTPGELVRLMVGRPLAQLFSRTEATLGDVALEVRGLTRAGEFVDVDLTVRRGEVVGLAGLIGAGRTEVAQAIAGVRPAQSGDIRVDGKPVRIGSPPDALRHGIAYVPEERRSQGLVLPLSIERNITFSILDRVTRFGFVQPETERQTAARFAEALAIRGAPLDAPASRLSGGNQQKVVVAKALAREPSILLLDEPTRGVDVGAKSEIYRIIDGLAQAGKAIVLISSELAEVLAMSDRVLVMREGRLVAELDRATATAERVTAAAMGVAAGAAALEPVR